jgi:hypothetical protein
MLRLERVLNLSNVYSCYLSPVAQTYEFHLNRFTMIQSLMFEPCCYLVGGTDMAKAVPATGRGGP